MGVRSVGLRDPASVMRSAARGASVGRQAFDQGIDAARRAVDPSAGIGKLRLGGPKLLAQRVIFLAQCAHAGREFGELRAECVHVVEHESMVAPASHPAASETFG